DRPRVVRAAEARQLDDLRWLGLDWDEGPDVGGPAVPYRQSERGERYEAALETLDRRGLLYRCDCSRAEIARVASAPHPGEEGPPWPGPRRALGGAGGAWTRPPALRLRAPAGEVVVEDRWQGIVRQDVAAAAGDFVLRRGDGVFAYQLAVVVDDLAMGITEVVRGADLLSSTPRQVLLAELLGGNPPRQAHVPVAPGACGGRPARGGGGVPPREQRAAGAAPGRLVDALARLLGLRPAGSARAMIPYVDPGVLAGALAGRATVRLPAGIALASR